MSASAPDSARPAIGDAAGAGSDLGAEQAGGPGDKLAALLPHFGERPPHAQDDWLLVHAMDLDAKGVARRADGKVIFIDGALPYEWVSATSHRKKNAWEAATVTAVHKESSQRVTHAARISACMPAPVAAARCSTCTLPRRWR